MQLWRLLADGNHQIYPIGINQGELGVYIVSLSQSRVKLMDRSKLTLSDEPQVYRMLEFEIAGF